MVTHHRPGIYRRALNRWGVARLAALGCASGLAAIMTAALAVSGVTRATNPELSLRYLPGDSLALATLAEQLVAQSPDAPPSRSGTLAMAALRQQPLNPKALRVLAVIAAQKSDAKKASALIRLADGQSRRDVGTQLWLIEEAVQRGDTRQALAHYDIALRTHPNAFTTLFPILLTAVDTPQIRQALAPYIRRDELWAPQFMAHAIENSSNLPALVDLLLGSGGLHDPAASRAQGFNLVNRLISVSLFTQARRLYAGIKGTNPARLTDTGFTFGEGASPPDPLNWQLRSDADASGQFLAGANGRPQLSLLVAPATTATVASKLLFVSPGRYRLSANVPVIDADDGAELRWQLRCPSVGGRPIWSTAIPAGASSADVVIPRDCTVQYLDLVAGGGSGTKGISATISQVVLRPVP